MLYPKRLFNFSEQDDFMIDFLGDDSVYYTRFSKNENINNIWVTYTDDLPSDVLLIAKNPKMSVKLNVCL